MQVHIVIYHVPDVASEMLEGVLAIWIEGERHGVLVGLFTRLFAPAPDLDRRRVL
jgi:hypothetical protein